MLAIATVQLALNFADKIFKSYCDKSREEIQVNLNKLMAKQLESFRKDFR
jgi:hypothetical protein